MRDNSYDIAGFVRYEETGRCTRARRRGPPCSGRFFFPTYRDGDQTSQVALTGVVLMRGLMRQKLPQFSKQGLPP